MKTRLNIIANKTHSRLSCAIMDNLMDDPLHTLHKLRKVIKEEKKNPPYIPDHHEGGLHHQLITEDLENDNSGVFDSLAENAPHLIEKFLVYRPSYVS